MVDNIPEFFSDWKEHIRSSNPCRRSGRLEAAVGATLLATLPGARLRERVLVGKHCLPADVFGFKDDKVVLLPAAGQLELSSGVEVRATGSTFRVPWSEALLGQVLDAQMRRMDGGLLPRACVLRPVDGTAPSAVERRPIERALGTGIRALDAFTTLGCGQRVGLFAGPGLGKSTLLGQIARNTQADCTVIALVGERGRELNEFIRRDLGQAGLARSVVVCTSSDASPGERAQALPVATAVAEGFRHQGRSVLLLVDSLTRHARALREIALSAGEPPGRRGFPPSVFDRLAAVIERTGNDRQGSITAIYSVLVEGEGDGDPVAQEAQGLLDGHIVLDPTLAQAGCFPAINPCASLSRLMDQVVSPEHLRAAKQIRALWSAYEQRRDLIAAGAYESGSEPLTDRAIALRPAILEFIRQDRDLQSSLDQTVGKLAELLGEIG